ncbi:MAG: aminotransferase class I/II-fold pyridoxal phosphate-dependent enzyme [Thermotogota bacterium]
MKLRDFELEVFFEQYEFSAPYLLTQSDCETMAIDSLLEMEPGSREAFFKQRLGYTEVTGSPELKERISNLYTKHGTEDVIVHTGAQEAIFNFLNIFLEPGDHVITQFPIYQSIYSVAEDIGCSVDKWRIRQSETGWMMDLEELEKLIKPETKLLCINNPNNPTGFIFNEPQMKRIAEIAEQNNIFVFCDEVYKGLELDGIKRPWFADLTDTALSLGVMSKAYGLPGLRIGWIVTGDKEVLDKMRKMKHFTSICNSAPSEFLATIALKHGEKILSKNRKLIKKNLEVSDRFFNKYKHLFRYNRQEAGPIAFHEMKIDRSIDEYCNQFVKDSGVLLLPGTVYDYPGTYFRMGYGRANFEENLKHFGVYLECE